MGQVINTALLHALNPDYAKALAEGERWALEHAARIDSINRREPEGMRRKFDGTSRKWCGGACPFPEGCVTCTLPENNKIAHFNRGQQDFEDSDF